MTKPFHVSLRPGERIYVNGAVLRADRKVSLEFLNDVTFLLEAHVITAEQTTTPLRQLYFIVQTILIDPSGAGRARELFAETHDLLMRSFENEAIKAGLKNARTLMQIGRAFDALKTIRGLFELEQDILSGPALAAEREREVA